MSTTAIDPEPSHSNKQEWKHLWQPKIWHPMWGLWTLQRQPLVQLTPLWLWLYGGEPELSGMHPSQDTLDKASAIYVGFSSSIVQLEIIVCWAGNPAVTGCTQFGCHEHICKRVVVSIHIKGWPIQVLVEFLNHCPLEGKKLQLVCWVVGFGLTQASTGIGYYCFGAILSGLIEDSSQTSATTISMEFEWFGEICIPKNRCHGTESLQVITGLLTPTVPLDGSLLLACIFTWGQLMQRSCHLHQFGDKSAVVSHESQETSDLHDVCGCGPILDSIDLAFISGYSMGGNHMLQISK